MKKYRLLTLFSVLLISLSACSNSKAAPIFEGDPSNKEDVISYINTLGADISSWDGYYGYYDYSYLMYDNASYWGYGDGWVEYEAYTINQHDEILARNTADGLVATEDYYFYWLFMGETDYSSYLEGDTLYENNGGLITTTENVGLTLADYAYDVIDFLTDPSDSILFEFTNPYYYGYEDWPPYFIFTSIVETLDNGDIKISLNLDYDGAVYVDVGILGSYLYTEAGYKYLELNYNKKGGLVSLDYSSYDDLFFYDATTLVGIEEELTSQEMHYYEYDGDIDKPSWLS